MTFDDINTDTLTVADGEWSQVAGMVAEDQSLFVRKIEVTTDSGTVEIAGEELRIRKSKGEA